MRIEVWSDVVCPWCYLGKRRLEAVLEATDIDAEVVHRAFQLDPGARTEGRSTVDVLAAKYGVDAAAAEAMMANVTEAARSEGLEYRLLDTVSGNTADAHRLVLWAQSEHGPAAGQRLMERILRTYFCEALPVFTPTQLLPLAGEEGLDVAAAEAMLAGEAQRQQVADDQRLAAHLGATGVPFFVIDRRIGIPGAQPREVFEQALRQAAETVTSHPLGSTRD